jgi:hypothetical protein
MVLAPVNIRSAGLAGTVEDMGGFDLIQNSGYGSLIVHSDACAVDIFVLSAE